MELTEPVKALLREAAQALTGSERRRFLARTVEELGPGGQRRAERELGWRRVTLRKGQRERASGVACVDGFALRGRKRAEAHLPALLDDLEAVVVGQSQADPSFRTTRLDTRLTAGEVRRRLIAEQGYTDAELPCVQTIGAKLNALGDYPQTVAKTQPQKRSPRPTPSSPRSAVNRAADAAGDTLRVAMDAKATVKRGPFSRKGRSRVPVAAADHDFQPVGTVTPVGMLLPESDEVFLYAVTSRVTSDCLADRLAQWWAAVRERFTHITTLVLNLDNGPENHSHRTQFVARLVQFASAAGLTIRLAYYPPYHSKYNPVERCWGILEQHWNGTLLDSLDAVLGFAASMTWKGAHPTVALVTTAYARGVTLTNAAMADVEAQLTRHPTLGRWFVDIPPPQARRDS